jgi:hypothetical protein
MSAWDVFFILLGYGVVWFMGAMWGHSKGYDAGYDQAKVIWKPHKRASTNAGDSNG